METWKQSVKNGKCAGNGYHTGLSDHQTIKDKMMQCGAVNAMMSGSGPTVFGIFNEREQAEKAAELLREEDKIRQMFVTTAM